MMYMCIPLRFALPGSLLPKGRFGHVATVARGNLMLVVGGYSGQVLDDLLVYKVPSAIAPPRVGPLVYLWVS